MQIISTDNMPKSNGHYSQCIEHNGLLYISGQLPIISKDKSVPDGIILQTKLVLEKLNIILLEAGSDKNNVIQVRIYIDDVNNWGIVNSIYAEFFGEHKPVRCIVPTTKLHFGCLIEIEAIAFI